MAELADKRRNDVPPAEPSSGGPQMERAKLLRPLEPDTHPLKKKIDAHLSECEATFGKTVQDKSNAVASVSGFKKLFVDPFGVRRKKYQQELSQADAEGAACINNATAATWSDVMRENNKAKR